MNSEKIIKPANGYLMVVITIALFILGIVMCINEENGFYLLFSIVGFFGFFGFILVNPNTSKVVLLFGKYVGTKNRTASIGQTHCLEKKQSR